MVTVPLVDPEGTLTGDLVEVIAGDAFAASSVTTRTTAGVPGLAATGSYQVDVYSYVVREAVFNGTALRSEDVQQSAFRLLK